MWFSFLFGNMIELFSYFGTEGSTRCWSMTEVTRLFKVCREKCFREKFLEIKKDLCLQHFFCIYLLFADIYQISNKFWISCSIIFVYWKMIFNFFFSLLIFQVRLISIPFIPDMAACLWWSDSITAIFGPI